MAELLRPPPFDITSDRRYRLTPREKPTFQSVVPVEQLITQDPDRSSVVRMRSDGGGVVVMDFEYPLHAGVIIDKLTLEERDGGGLATAALQRRVESDAGVEVRREDVDFTDRTIPLPEATYPEVALPFLLSFQPLDGKTRDLFAWINDRFLARVDFRTTGQVRLELPDTAEAVPAIKGIMYPDFNDWVRLPRLVTKLTELFVPKYHMWFAAEPPHEVLRFEGPYGPPGAPEITMTLLPEQEQGPGRSS